MKTNCFYNVELTKFTLANAMNDFLVNAVGQCYCNDACNYVYKKNDIYSADYRPRDQFSCHSSTFVTLILFFSLFLKHPAYPKRLANLFSRFLKILLLFGGGSGNGHADTVF